MKNTAPSPQDLLRELQALLTEAENMVAGSSGESLAGALGTLRARFDAAQERCVEACASARKKVVAGAKFANETIRANPYESIAVAAGVALVVGVLLGRRTR